MGAPDQVVVYIVQNGCIAAFTHCDDDDPLFESGLQVPAGSVEPGEPIEDAAVREATEESGLVGVRLIKFLGEDVIQWPGRPPRRRHFFHAAADRCDATVWIHTAPAEGGRPRTFRFVWLSILDAPLLAGAQGLLAHQISI